MGNKNVNDTYWPRGQNWACQLTVVYDKAKGRDLFHSGSKWKRYSINRWKRLPTDFVFDPVPLLAL